MKTWTKNLLNSEHEEWFSGKRKHEEPEKNEKGQYISSLPVVLFQMIEQQLSVASKTKRSTFKGLVLQECIEALFYFQENFEQMIRQQGERFLNDEPNNEFFNEYMMIVVNNCCKCTQYAQHLAINLLEELDFSTRDRTKTRVANVVRGFQKLAQSAYSFLIKVILKDSQDCFSSFFTKNWYSKTSQDLETILLTTDDYFQDFQAHMVEDMFIQYVTETYYYFLLEYTSSLFHKNAIINPEKIGELMENDMRKLNKLFSNYGALHINEKYATLKSLKELCECSVEFFTLSFVDLKQKHPEFSLDMMDMLLQKRKDISRSYNFYY
jgi:exocyst complex component 3